MSICLACISTTVLGFFATQVSNCPVYYKRNTINNPLDKILVTQIRCTKESESTGVSKKHVAAGIEGPYLGVVQGTDNTNRVELVGAFWGEAVVIFNFVTNQAPSYSIWNLESNAHPLPIPNGYGTVKFPHRVGQPGRAIGAGWVKLVVSCGRAIAEADRKTSIINKQRPQAIGAQNSIATEDAIY
nr:hypothetical protein Itr_chr10CG06080 [Ipomoea trifida]